MITRSFDILYQQLTVAAHRYHSVERSPDRVAALADARWELHLARQAIADERARLEAGGFIYTAVDRRWLDGLGIDA